MNNSTRPTAVFLRSTLLAASMAIFGLAACDSQESGSAIAEAPEGQYKFTIVDADLVVGRADAPITIVEYSSMTCPHCAQFHEAVYPAMKSNYIDTGKAKLVFRPFPLDGYAAQASLLIKCAPDKIQMPLVDAIFTRQETWMRDTAGPQEGLVKIAREAQISRETFAGCVADEDNQAWLQGHMADAREKYDVASTPTFYINGEKIAGLTDVAALDRIMAKFTGEGVSD